MDRNQEIDIRNRDNDEIEIDLLELFSYYISRIWWIIGGFLVGALLAGLVTHFVITPKYTATAQMYMVSSGTQSVVDLTDLNIGQSISSDYVELLQTRPIIESVIKEQNLDYSYGQLVGMLNLSVLTDTRIIVIMATSTDAREAMNIANSLAEKGVSELPKLMETPEPHIAEYAIVPVNRSSPSLTKNTMIGALLGMLLMLAIFTSQFLMDDTFKTADDIEREFGVMPLTVIPEGKIEGLDDSVDDERRKRGRSRKRSRNKKYYSKSKKKKQEKN
ncbi:MAG: capsular polysaccharide biosynthesis protein [Mogibacterium sp.]|nr:capsular polysaccharide biosynthesis protein [Mogibacterium sp.]